MKTKDIFIWYYKDTKEKFEPYHCCSRIAIFDGEKLVDTFWGNISRGSRWFTPEQCDKDLELFYLGNLLDFSPCDKSDQAMYDDEDFMDISHKNNNRGNCYLRKGASKSKEKMTKVLKRNTLELERRCNSAKSEYQRELNKLEGLTPDTYVYGIDGVSLDDESYQDGE